MTTTASYRKSIEYDPESRDFRMMLDGELVGFESSYHRAEITLDQLVFELISGEYFTQKRIYPAKFPPACPSCGDAVREAGPLAACREAGENLDAVADCAAGNTLHRCPKCGEIDQAGLDFVCRTCADVSHRCAAGHALDDNGRCDVCQDRVSAPCGFCRGPHHVQHCKDLLAMLCGNDVLMPHLLARLLQRHPSLALAFPSELPHALLVRQADMHAAWLDSHLDGASADRLLAAWLAKIGGEEVRGVPRYELLAA